MVGPDVNMGRSNPYPPPSIRFGHIQEISWFLAKIHQDPFMLSLYMFISRAFFSESNSHSYLVYNSFCLHPSPSMHR